MIIKITPQIEEMARTLCGEKEKTCTKCDSFDLCEFWIEASTLHNASYRKQAWISVNERLPDNHRSVLVACEGLTIGGYAPIVIGSYGGGFWSLADADGTKYLTKYMRCVVTHWMPLPEAPKGE